MKKNDLYLLGIILAAAFLLSLFSYFVLAKEGVKVTITQDGRETGTYPLLSDDSILIEDSAGGTNRLIIQNGEAFISEADCPDKLCVHQKAISKSGESIICLPHKLVIEVMGGEESRMDAVTR